jgi:hypothetical protein
VDGIERRVSLWPDWAITICIDTQDYWKTTWDVVFCHKTQMAIFSKLDNLPESHHYFIWGTQEYCRASSLVNGERHRENDLFEGIER